MGAEAGRVLDGEPGGRQQGIRRCNAQGFVAEGQEKKNRGALRIRGAKGIHIAGEHQGLRWTFGTGKACCKGKGRGQIKVKALKSVLLTWAAP